MTVQVQSESKSFWDAYADPSTALITAQVDPSAPAVAGLESVTSPIFPDRSVLDRLAHFPDDLYDLRSTSHLVRLMQALLGDSGAGQLRKRNIVVQFQSTLASTHFYDLDRFYGAIFGVTRTIEELLGLDPTIDTATTNEWDSIANRDATYRDRIQHLAAAINMGATLPGIQAAAEALIQVPCDVYESWQLLDAYGPGGPGHVWNEIEAMGTWDQIESSDTRPNHPDWIDMEDAVVVGYTQTNTRAEVFIRPKKDYDSIAAQYSPQEAARQRAEDQLSLLRVLDVLKPASVLLTVDFDGLALHQEAPMANLVADSNFWAVVTQVVPRPDLRYPDGSPYPVSLNQAIEGVLESAKHEVPKPPWSVTSAARWSYAPEAVSVKSYTFQTGADDTMTEAGDGPIIDTATADSVTYHDGTTERFGPDRAVLDPRRALAARYASEGILVCAPYSGPRVAVTPSA